MEIVDKREMVKPITAADIEVGEVFMHYNSLCIRTNGTYSSQCSGGNGFPFRFIDLRGSQENGLSMSAEVTRVNAKVVIE